MSLRKRYITIIVLTGCLAAILLGRVATSRMIEHLQKLDGQIEQYTNELDRARNESQDNAEYEDKWQDINSFQLETVFDRKNNFMQDLLSMAAEQNIICDVSASSEQEMENNEEFQVISYTLSFSTNLSDMVEFLSQLDSSLELLRLERLVISGFRIHPARTARYEHSLVTTKVLDLSVDMTISTPSALPVSDIMKGNDIYESN